MKKNNKGFTLIELLATMVILGILCVFAIPQLTGVLDRSKDKMYATDAAKLLSLAEREVKANASIHYPDDKHYIVVTLGYFNSSEFDITPHGGVYEPEKSGVVIYAKKAENGKTEYKYYVTLVENYKGYRGYKSISAEDLAKEGASKKVESIPESVMGDDLFYNLREYYYDIYASVINGASISTIYTARGDATSIISGQGAGKYPKIQSLSVTPVNNGIDKIMSKVKIFVRVKYEGSRSMKLCFKFGSSASQCVDESNGLQKDGSIYTYHSEEINLLNNCSVGGECKIEVTADAGNNLKSSKQYTYKITTDQPPRIDTTKEKFYLKSDNPVRNLFDVNIHLEVFDDFDGVDDLMVCFSENNECTDYKKYSEVFDKNYMGKYKFKCELDGKQHPLKIFVKDHSGNIDVKEVLDYTTGQAYKIYENKAPTINNVIVESVNSKFNDLNVKVKIKWKDDLDTANDIKIFLNGALSSDCTSSTSSGVVTSTCKYKFSGKYDGVTRNLQVKLRDQYNKESSKPVSYTPYKNLEPVVENINISSSQKMCSSCNGGSLSAIVDLVVKDDLDEAKDLKVCVSEVNSPFSCSNYLNYKTNFVDKAYTYNFTPTDATKPYDGSTRTLYFFIMDSYGDLTEKTKTYTLFNDKQPEATVNAYKFDDKVMVSFIVNDFLDSYTVCLAPEGSECTEWYDGSNLERHDYTINNLVDEVSLLIKDKYGNILNKTVTPESSYAECTLGKDYTYSYTKAGSDKISPSICDGKCYKTSTITAPYNKKIDYFDRFIEGKSCSKTENYVAHCDFHLCFKFGDQYSDFVIGTKVYTGDISITIGDTTYEASHYYKVYKSSYDASSGSIVLTPTTIRVPAQSNSSTGTYDVISYYKFNANKNNYVRVQD